MFEVMDPPGEDKPCRVCGRALFGDADDQPKAPLGPICGECYRAREFDQTIWEQETLDED